ncbi:hypothetical protein IV203_017618 [Nitzschia inconspicua]|uniref:Uncharacterized protein n=1 Tax=Nitzschia inconspicua TaxID=303405 RepID=A0A9K3K5S9_9STRA|nr:hypothetical protein IV203_017618 [Nitzschia inconspicua]
MEVHPQDQNQANARTCSRQKIKRRHQVSGLPKPQPRPAPLLGGVKRSSHGWTITSIEKEADLDFLKKKKKPLPIIGGSVTRHTSTDSWKETPLS